jgi:hypothetical protein
MVMEACMDIFSSDNVKYVDAGSADIWFSLKYTVTGLLKEESRKIKLADTFLEKGSCASTKAKETAKQMRIVKDELSKYSADEVIYNEKNHAIKAPWLNNRSEHITKCNQAFVTADGKNLLDELIDILEYAGDNGVDVVCPEL